MIRIIFILDGFSHAPHPPKHQQRKEHDKDEQGCCRRDLPLNVRRRVAVDIHTCVEQEFLPHDLAGEESQALLHDGGLKRKGGRDQRWDQGKGGVKR